jgi:uncharacterized protein (TIGR03083 family)
MRQRTRRPAPTLVPAVLGQWERVTGAVAELPDEAFAEPSRLPGRTVADVVVHAAGTAALLARVLSGPDAPAAETTAIGCLGRGIGRGRSRVTAVAASDAETVKARLRDDVAAAAAALHAAAAGAGAGAGDDDRLVATPAGGMRLADFLAVHAVEGVVHGLDLGVDPARDALRIGVRLLVDALVEADPGRSVELRVPPFAAAQLVEGPRHTRGTPPNVVEADPVAFVEVAAGRSTWVDAVADGRIRASGERADLSRLLPVLQSP